MILGIAVAQWSLAVYATSIDGWRWFLLCWALGGTLTHWLFLGNHELAHNLCFKKTLYNELLGMVANMGQGLPSCVTFKKYHLEHHYYQGVDVIDGDVPTNLEGKIFNTTFKKIIWVILQPAFYALRPIIVNPKPMCSKEAANIISTVAFDAAFAYFFGIKALLFNVAGTILGMGIHPVASHFISEHYTFKEGQETYSYYGWLNLVTFNVGYHNEHHGFPRIPGFKLPMVRKIAPEFYDPLHSYDSWPGVIYDYIFRIDIGPYSRIKRSNSKVDESRRYSSIVWCNYYYVMCVLKVKK
jgi:sphingolipid delta-4 desaturase